MHFPWLRDECPIEENNNSVGHPVSGSSVHLCLFHRFHERNVKGKREILRRITFIPELKGLLNSECDEQLHYVYYKDTRFLNQMQPLNHIFMFKSDLDIRNIRINQSVIDDISKSIPFELSFDRFGRIPVDKTQRKKAKTTTQYYNILPDKQQGQERDESPDEAHVPNNSPEQPRGPQQQSKSSTKYWIKHLNLRNNYKEDILEGKWLNDRVINAAAKILKEECPLVGGLYDTALAARYGYPEASSLFVQFININNYHWVVASNLLSSLYLMLIYDSLTDIFYRTDREEIRYPVEVEISICQCLRLPCRFDIGVVDVQQQTGGNDCGVFAICFASLLCAGKSLSLSVLFHV